MEGQPQTVVEKTKTITRSRTIARSKEIRARSRWTRARSNKGREGVTIVKLTFHEKFDLLFI